MTINTFISSLKCSFDYSPEVRMQFDLIVLFILIFVWLA